MPEVTQQHDVEPGEAPDPVLSAPEILEIKLFQDVKSRLLTWEKQRYWQVFLILAVFTTFGGWALIRGEMEGASERIEVRVSEKIVSKVDNEIRPLITEVTDEISKARKATDQARNSEMEARLATNLAAEEAKRASRAAASATLSAEQAGGAARDATRQAQGSAEMARGVADSAVALLADLEKRAGQVDALLGALAGRQEAQSQTFNEVAQRYEEDIQRLSQELLAVDSVLAALRKEARTKVTEVERLRGEEREKRAFLDNTRYLVEVYHLEGTRELAGKAVGELTGAGFRASSVALFEPTQSQLGGGSTLAGHRTINAVVHTSDARTKAQEVATLLSKAGIEGPFGVEEQAPVAQQVQAAISVPQRYIQVHLVQK